jgi:hypothetical protein
LDLQLRKNGHRNPENPESFVADFKTGRKLPPLQVLWLFLNFGLPFWQKSPILYSWNEM